MYINKDKKKVVLYFGKNDNLIYIYIMICIIYINDNLLSRKNAGNMISLAAAVGLQEITKSA